MTPGCICKHVSAGASILRAVRDALTCTNDSGSALVCDRVGHVTADYLVVNLDNYYSRDQSLVDVLDLPPYTARTSEDLPWVIETRGLPPEMQN